MHIIKDFNQDIKKKEKRKHSRKKKSLNCDILFA